MWSVMYNNETNIQMQSPRVLLAVTAQSQYSFLIDVFRHTPSNQAIPSGPVN